MMTEDRLRESIDRLARQHPMDREFVAQVIAHLPERPARPQNRWLFMAATALTIASALLVMLIVLDLLPMGTRSVGPAPSVDASAGPNQTVEASPASTPAPGGIELYLAYVRHEQERDPSLDRYAIRIIATVEIRPGLVLAIADYANDEERFVVMSWVDSEWQVAARGEPDVISTRAEAGVLAEILGAELGLSEDWLVVYGPLPNGPIGQLELEINGVREPHSIRRSSGAFLLVFPSDAALSPDYRFLDSATYVLGEGEVVFK